MLGPIPRQAGLAQEAGECLDLARREIEDLSQRPDEDAGNSSANLAERLQRANAVQSTDPNVARAIRQAIIELYQDKPWAADAVARARKAMDAEAAKKGPKSS